MKPQAFLNGVLGLMFMKLFLCSRSIPAQAQNALGTVTPNKTVFHHLTIIDGLSHNTVTDALQDRQGFIRATTAQGIKEYDGMTFTTYTPQVSNSGQSTPQFYMKILEDRDGILCFCNYEAGLARYDLVLDTEKAYVI